MNDPDTGAGNVDSGNWARKLVASKVGAVASGPGHDAHRVTCPVSSPASATLKALTSVV